MARIPILIGLDGMEFEHPVSVHPRKRCGGGSPSAVRGLRKLAPTLTYRSKPTDIKVSSRSHGPTAQTALRPCSLEGPPAGTDFGKTGWTLVSDQKPFQDVGAGPEHGEFLHHIGVVFDQSIRPSPVGSGGDLRKDTPVGIALALRHMPIQRASGCHSTCPIIDACTSFDSNPLGA